MSHKPNPRSIATGYVLLGGAKWVPVWRLKCSLRHSLLRIGLGEKMSCHLTLGAFEVIHCINNYVLHNSPMTPDGSFGISRRRISILRLALLFGREWLSLSSTRETAA